MKKKNTFIPKKNGVVSGINGICFFIDLYKSQKLKEKLKEVLAKGETGTLVNELVKISGQLKNKNLKEEILLMAANYERYLKEKRLGTSSAEQQDIKISRISQSLFQIIEKLPDSDRSGSIYGNAPLISKKLKKRKNGWAKLVMRIIGIILGIIFLFGILIFSIVPSDLEYCEMIKDDLKSIIEKCINDQNITLVYHTEFWNKLAECPYLEVELYEEFSLILNDDLYLLHRSFWEDALVSLKTGQPHLSNKRDSLQQIFLDSQSIKDKENDLLKIANKQRVLFEKDYKIFQEKDIGDMLNTIDENYLMGKKILGTLFDRTAFENQLSYGSINLIHPPNWEIEKDELQPELMYFIHCEKKGDNYCSLDISIFHVEIDPFEQIQSAINSLQDKPIYNTAKYDKIRKISYLDTDATSVKFEFILLGKNIQGEIICLNKKGKTLIISRNVEENKELLQEVRNIEMSIEVQ